MTGCRAQEISEDFMETEGRRMYEADKKRYERMQYRRCGNSGVLLPRISFGLWQNFGLEKTLEEHQELLCHAFDCGITHFDLIRIGKSSFTVGF